MIKVLIFDLGGVVAVASGDFWKLTLAKISEKYHINKTTLTREFKKAGSKIDTGKMSLIDFYSQFLKNQSIKNIKPQALLKINMDIYRQVYRHDMLMVKYIKELQKTYTVVCLTNTEQETAKVNTKDGLYAYFEKAFISCHINKRKPTLAIYRHVLKTLNVKPEECIFIDDLQKHIDGANKAGIHTILYTNIIDLKSKIYVISHKEEGKTNKVYLRKR